jgi:hypothetical protein
MMSEQGIAEIVEFVRRARDIGYGHPTGQYVDAACALADELDRLKVRERQAFEAGMCAYFVQNGLDEHGFKNWTCLFSDSHEHADEAYEAWLESRKDH